jgi:hypothetical protein
LTFFDAYLMIIPNYLVYHLMIIMNYLMPYPLLLCLFDIMPAALQVSLRVQLQAWPLSSRRQDITQLLMKFVAQLTHHIGDIFVLVFTCGFQNFFSSADRKQ